MLITLARKPMEGTVANNVLIHGCGALNIDASRIATADDFSGLQGFASMKLNAQRKGESDEDWKARVKSGPEQQASLAKLRSLGRWPANVLLTSSEAVLAGFPETGKSTGTKNGSWRTGHQYEGGYRGADASELGDEVGFGDSGSAARYFKQIG